MGPGARRLISPWASALDEIPDARAATMRNENKCFKLSSSFPNCSKPRGAGYIPIPAIGAKLAFRRDAHIHVAGHGAPSVERRYELPSSHFALERSGKRRLGRLRGSNLACGIDYHFHQQLGKV